MRYIGIDYGSKRVGVAFSDELATMGFPHVILQNTPALADTVVALIKERSVDAMVMGESKDFHGVENEVAYGAKVFSDEVSDRTGIPIFFESETFTTTPLMPPPPPSSLPVTFLIMITIDELNNIKIQIGTILSAVKVPKSDKLLQLRVDFGEETPRQIISGIVAYVSDAEETVGKQFAFVTNIEPRTIFGLESNGMLFAVGKEDTFAFLTPHHPVPPGTSAH